MGNKTSFTEKQLGNLTKEQLVELTLVMQDHVRHLEEQNSDLRRRLYGRKSEKINPDQLSLFNEGEFTDDAATEEEKKEPQLPSGKKNKSGSRNSKLRNVEVVETYINPESTKCPECGSPMQEIKPLVKEYLEYQPAKYILHKYIIRQYTCHKCNDENMDMQVYTGDTSSLPARLIEGSFVTPSLVANIGTNKFILGLPFYRQEKDLNRRGLPFSRQNLCSWVLRSSEMYLAAVYEKMHEDLLTLEIQNWDETTLNCLEEKENKVNYIWGVMSGQYEEKQMMLYFYSANRKYNNVPNILGNDYSGVMQSDGFQAYGLYEGTDKKAGCFAHARRKVYEAITSSEELHKKYKAASTEEKKKLLEDNPSFAVKIRLLALIDMLFANEKDYKELGLTPDEILERRKADDPSILQSMKELVDQSRMKFLPQEKMGKALTYISNQWEPLNYFMKDGRVPISNNIIEREGIKPVVIARKNFLFADTIHGAEQSMIWFSLLISASLNHLNPEKYITYVLEQLSTYGCKDEVVERCLPYSKNIPDTLKVPVHTR